ncbi:uncharacterized protein MONBRDRAFT_2660, partial [Monosiga brevicollis MX1]
FLQEAEIMAQFQHPHVVELQGVCLQEQPWLLIQELSSYGDFDNVLRTARMRDMALTQTEALHFINQLAAACSYVLSKGVLHLDIAARNLLLFERNTLKLADFGNARQLPQGKKYIQLEEPPKVAARWLAVEAMTQLRFSEASDVWAAAVAAWEILSMGTKPYPDTHFLQVMRVVVAGERLPQTELCSDDLYALLLKCWDVKPDRRPSFADLLTKV